MASHFPLCGWQASRRASARIRRVVWICISTILMQSAPRMKDHERRLLSWRAWRALAFWRETGLAAFRSHPAKNPAPTFSTTCAKRHPNPQTPPSSMEAERTGPHAPANTHMNNPNEPRTPTEAQINANRENAKKSTGPRTAEGKAASSRNRLLHGLRANKHILLDEDPEEFLFLLDDHLDRFQPVGASEENLVLRFAPNRCRLARVFSNGARTAPCYHKYSHANREGLRAAAVRAALGAVVD